MLYAHHPDMMFGAIEFKRAGAKIVAHPNTQVLAGEGGPDQMLADWDRVVGLQELLGFEYANVPDLPVTGSDTLRLGGAQSWYFTRLGPLGRRPDALAASGAGAVRR